MSGRDLSGFSLWELYRAEVESHSATLNDGLLALEQEPSDVRRIDGLMRAAHSIKGAARVVQHPLAVQVAHAMEDRLVAAQEGRQPLGPDDMQLLIDGVDLLGRLSPVEESRRDEAVTAAREDADRLVAALSAPHARTAATGDTPAESVVPAVTTGVGPARAPAPPPAEPAQRVSEPPGASPSPASVAPGDRAIRLTAQSVNRLMGLSGEATVATRWLAPFSERLLGLKRELTEASTVLQTLENMLFDIEVGDEAALTVNEVQMRLERARATLTEYHASLERFATRQEVLADRLHREVVATRMRPFGDIVEGMPRLVRDVARQLGKRVRLEIDGRATEVDRDVGALLESPLIHLVRNAVDHGIEGPDDRARAGKPDTGTIRLTAFHRAGMLRVVVWDDGRGVDLPALRTRIVERGLTDEATAGRLSEDELLAFLFLPGFSTATSVSEISGRGVGLDVVREATKAIGGRFQVANDPGRGLAFTFDLPLTLSVLSALVVEIAGEPYAFPVTRVERVASRPREQVRVVEGREYVTMRFFRPGPATASGDASMEERHIGLVSARQVLGIGGPLPASETVSIVVIREERCLYGLAVDRIVGEQSVVVRPLDTRLGKVRNVGAAALMVDGTPVLVLDVDDLARSIDQILTGGRLAPLASPAVAEPVRRKRVLVVDDSITVREIERQLLETHGYAVDVAVDGMDGWNAVRTGHYDLVVTDVDMPRLDGVELVRRLRADHRYTSLPVMIVSYKDRDDDRLRGLDAGASYYLPKSSFQDDRFLVAVDELIGRPEGP